jgi:hypothetical protein
MKLLYLCVYTSGINYCVVVLNECNRMLKYNIYNILGIITGPIL